MNVLALHSLGHDSGVSYFRDGRLAFSIETERLTRRKHDHRVALALRYALAHREVDAERVDIVAVDSPVRNSILRIPDVDRAMEAITQGALHYRTSSRLLDRATECVIVTHEVAHAALAAHYAQYRDGALILVNEGRGQVSRSSLFRITHGHMEWIEKDPLPWYGNGFGWSALGYLFGFGKGPGIAGRVMAAGGYGVPSPAIREMLAVIPNQVMDDRKLAERIGRDLARHVLTGKFSAVADLTATFQAMFTESVGDLLAGYASAPGEGQLALGGGCALNIVANAALRDRFNRDIAIPPACGDSGHPLGAGIYAYRLLGGQEVEPFGVGSNGQAEPTNLTLRTLRAAGLTPKPYDVREVAEALATGRIVAWVDGAAELGPRALGHRSLLGDPTRAGMRKRMSEELKQREWFRPLAAVMQLERFEALFPSRYPSPYMLFSYDIPEGFIPEARHADGTSRLQTVRRDDHPRLHELLGEFERQTGCPALINTSLNGPGRAIAYRTTDVLDDFLKSDVALFVFDELMAYGDVSSGKDARFKLTPCCP